MVLTVMFLVLSAVGMQVLCHVQLDGGASWPYDFLTVDVSAYALGTAEIVAAPSSRSIRSGPEHQQWEARLLTVLLLGTVSLLLTSPGVVGTCFGAVPVLSAMPGQILLKDFVLLGVAMWTLGDSLSAGVLECG